MKQLIRKKWLRRSTQGLVVVVSLLGLASAMANRRAAVAKRDALSSLKLGGNLVEAAKFKIEMPPDDENFGMIPLLVKLRAENGDADREGEGEVQGKFASMARNPMGQPIGRPRLGEPWDPAIVARDFQLTGTPAEMLEQFDRRHAVVLAALREGMGRRWAVMPSPIDLANPKEEPGGYKELIGLRSAAVGIALRAELAIDAGKGEVALESLLINRRLAEFASSQPMAIGWHLAWSIDRQSIPPLFRGIASGIWDASSLARLRAAWSGRESRESIERVLNVEGVAMAIFYDHCKRDRSLGPDLLGSGDDLFSRMGRSAIPNFWFDDNSASVLRTTEDALELVRTEGPLQSWWDQFVRDEKWAGYPGPMWIRKWGPPKKKSFVEDLFDLEPSSFGNLADSVLRRGSRMIVDEALVRLACRLGEYKIAHGSYPPSLAAIGGIDIIDPLSGQPFTYRLEDGRFVIYSVGPNGVDDGAPRRPKSMFGTVEQPDWVW